MRSRLAVLAAVVIAVTSFGATPAQATNTFNAQGYMVKASDYAGVKVQNAGAGVIGVRAKYNYNAPGSGATTYESATYFDTSPTAGVPVTTPTPPDRGYTYTTISHFRGCSSTGDWCALGAWDSNATLHVFS